MNLLLLHVLRYFLPVLPIIEVLGAMIAIPNLSAFGKRTLPLASLGMLSLLG